MSHLERGLRLFIFQHFLGIIVENLVKFELVGFQGFILLISFTLFSFSQKKKGGGLDCNYGKFKKHFLCSVKTLATFFALGVNYQ